MLADDNIATGYTEFSLLVVDDEPLVQRAVAALWRRYGPCTEALSIEAAASILNQSWDGLVLDVRLTDGCGLELLETMRRHQIWTPTVVLSGAIDHATVNRVVNLDAWLVSKPCGLEEFAGFVGEVIERKTGSRFRACAERARCLWRLSDRETQLIELALQGEGREVYLRDAKVSRNTYKTQVRRLLRKTGYRSLSEIASYLWCPATRPWASQCSFSPDDKPCAPRSAR